MNSTLPTDFDYLPRARYDIRVAVDELLSRGYDRQLIIGVLLGRVSELTGQLRLLGVLNEDEIYSMFSHAAAVALNTSN